MGDIESGSIAGLLTGQTKKYVIHTGINKLVLIVVIQVLLFPIFLVDFLTEAAYNPDKPSDFLTTHDGRLHLFGLMFLMEMLLLWTFSIGMVYQLVRAWIRERAESIYNFRSRILETCVWYAVLEILLWSYQGPMVGWLFRDKEPYVIAIILVSVRIVAEIATLYW